jgi:hypothetical protein
MLRSIAGMREQCGAARGIVANATGCDDNPAFGCYGHRLPGLLQYGANNEAIFNEEPGCWGVGHEFHAEVSTRDNEPGHKRVPVSQLHRTAMDCQIEKMSRNAPCDVEE